MVIRKDYGRYYSLEKPLDGIETPVLLECWLTADQHPENWEAIRQKYPGELYWTSRDRFREMVANYPETGALFGGLEKRIYEFFTPTRCRFEDYKDRQHMREELFDGVARQVSGQIGNGLVDLLGGGASPFGGD